MTTVSGFSSFQVPDSDVTTAPRNEPPGLAQGVVGVCGSCDRPWFGAVVYCPFCGHDPRSAIADQEIASPLAVPAETAQASAQGVRTFRKTIFGRNISVEWGSAGAPQPSGTASARLFKIVAAAIAALLVLWMAARLLAPVPREGPSPALARTHSGTVLPMGGPPASAPQMPSSMPPRTGTAVPPQSNRALCSEASEAAGLCKAQQ